MASKYPPGFYVYAHIRKTDGKVFYVGKGKGNRLRLTRDRTPHWKRVANKHGFLISVVSDGMSEDCALTREKIEIFKHRSIGSPLVNICDGGLGRTGYRSPENVPVHSSLGEQFPSVTDAVIHLTANGHELATDGGIYSCLNGKQRSSYGRAWSYFTYPAHPDLVGRSANIAACISTTSKPISCSNGMTFKSAGEAARWLRGNGHPKATPSRISMCRTGGSQSAYGFSWWDEGDAQKPYVYHGLVQSEKQGKTLVMDGSVEFRSTNHAVSWLKENGWPKAERGSVSLAVNGKRSIAYGHKWAFKNE